MKRLTFVTLISLLTFATLALLAGCGSAAPKHGVNPAAEGHKPEFRLVPIPPQKHLQRRALALAAPDVNVTPNVKDNVVWAEKPVYADNFANPLGSLDSTWLAHTHDNGCCGNGDEIMSERPSKVRQDESGLKLLCTKESTVSGKPFTCGGVSTAAFRWTPGQGQTMAFEVRSQLPPRDFGEDPGWWSTDTKWTDELDFQEDWEWNHEEYFAGLPVWKAQIGGCVVQHEAYKLKSEIPNPETEFHTYTTVVRASGEEEEWIDGVKRWSLPAPCGINKPSMSLILTHALRVSSNLTGTNSFSIRSVAVYEDAAHKGVGVVGSAIAPGTTLTGELPKEEKETTTPTETTPPPPPPPPAAPAVPTGCKGEGNATPEVKLSCASSSLPSGGTLEWQRTGPWCEASRYPIWTTTSTVTASNRLCVEHAKRYDWSVRAHNSAGTSAWTAPIVVYTP